MNPRRPATMRDADCLPGCTCRGTRPLPGLSPREALRLRGKSEAAGVVAFVALVFALAVLL